MHRPQGLRLGVIADDFTGATDVANALVRHGLRVEQTIGVPQADAQTQADALVVALKSRTAPADQAVAQSLAAARWLQAAGAGLLYFKVCSTFDSTARGNIGPVTEALMALTGASFVPVTPAFPKNGRTVFNAHLFVGDTLLADSPMRHHPLTPMTESDLRRVLQPQLARERVGSIGHATVARGAAAIVEAAGRLRAEDTRLAIVDSVDDAALHALAQATVTAGWPLVVAGSGLAIGLPAAWGIGPDATASTLPPAQGYPAIIAGSCSAATQAQVADFIAHGGSALCIDPMALAVNDTVVADALDWAASRLGSAPVLVYATAAPAQLQRVQAALGVARAGTLVEQALAQIAQGLVERGVGRLIVAGGETSGACVQALGIRRLKIGPQIDPGVPWCHAEATIDATPQSLHLALKSGNFGGVDFFRRAFALLA